MKLARRQTRPQPETIVALIDVVFFLLVFFMLIGRMDASSPFSLLPPLAQSGANLPAGGMTIAIGADGQLALDGELSPRKPLVEKVAQATIDDSSLLVRINAHQTTELRHILPLVAELESVGAANVVFVVTPHLP